MLLPLRMFAGLVALAAAGKVAILLSTDFLKYAEVAYGGNLVAALAPREAAFIIVQLVVILLASCSSLFILVWHVSKPVWWTAVGLALLAIVVALIDPFWLPVLAALQSASFLTFAFTHPSAQEVKHTRARHDV